jgi:hypothetical protein
MAGVLRDIEPYGEGGINRKWHQQDYELIGALLSRNSFLTSK